MSPYIAEAVGTMILILLGDGVVANVLLARSKGQDSGWMVITVGWGVAVTVAVYAVGRISGAHLNPAVTIALATIGSFPGRTSPGTWRRRWLEHSSAPCWCGWHTCPLAPDRGPVGQARGVATAPAIRSTGANIVTEVIGTAVLLFGVLAIGANAGGWAQAGDVDLSQVFSRGLQPLLVGILVLGIGLSLGGPTGYAINPARDLGPRLAHAILPMAGKGSSDWSYGWIPVVAPIGGGIIGAALLARLYAAIGLIKGRRMTRYVGALDQGTTSTRFMVFDAAGAEVARRQIEQTQIMPRPGWVEHDPVEIAARTNEVITGALRAADLDGKRSRSNRRHQSARDHRGVESENRPPLVQRHRLAGHAD